MGHACLLARGEGRPRQSAGAGPVGGCHRAGGVGKSDASRAPDSGPGRRVAGPGDRRAHPGSAGAGGRRRGDCGRVPPGDTGGYSRRARDHTRDRGRRAAGTTGRPASGGSPRPRGPGDVRWAVDTCEGMCDTLAKPLMPPRGGCARGSGGSSSRPSSFSLRDRGSLPENWSPFHSQRQHGWILTLLSAVTLY